MSFLARLLLGTGTLKPELRAALESEGLVLIEEGLPGKLRYHRFRAPGRYHHGKVTLQRIGLGMSRERFVMYCRSGRSRLVDSPFSEPRLSALELSVEDGETLKIRIDFDRVEVPKVSGVMTIEAQTPSAARIVGELQARLPRRPSG